MMKHDKLFKDMLICDSVRGTDSTGIIAVSSITGHAYTAKQVGNPFELFSDKRFDRAMLGANKVLIGHNRYATQGKVTRENAHPFDMGNLVGVHNGTLDNKHVLLDHREFDVDSENLYWDMEVNGVSEAISKALGAWALVWWNKKDQTLNLLRNEERPLSIATDADGVIYGCSERGMLEWMLSRNGIKVETLISLETDKHVSLHIGDNGIIDEPVITEVKGAQVPFVVMGNPPNVADIMKAGGKNSSRKRTTAKQEKQLSTIEPANGKEYTKQEFCKNFSAGYSVKKAVEFEVICTAVDKSGSNYTVLYDEEHPEYTIRLYNHSAHAVQTLPQYSIISADIGGFTGDRTGGYYKVSPWTVKVVNRGPVVEVSEDEDDATQAIEDIGQLDGEWEVAFEDHNGRYMAKTDWMQKYKGCDGCDEQIDPEMHEYAFTTAGQIVCAQCAIEFKDMVTLK